MDELSGIIQNTLTKISDLKIPLNRVSSESEPQFVNLGNNLQDIFADAEGLTTLTRETAMLIDAESSDNILGNIGDFSRESIVKLDACRKDVSNILPNVEKCSSNLKRLYDMCPVIRTIAKKLNIVALHISMESSRSRECEEMFNFFVKEIKQLANKVHDISIKIRDDSETAKSRQVADFTSLADKKDKLSSLADNARRSVADNVHHIEDLIKMALQTMRSAEVHSQKISSLVGDVVVAIQFHDIARQQIEHIVQALDEINTFFNKDQTDALVNTYVVLSMQVEQLKEVINEINGSYKKIKKSFDDIGHEVDVLVGGMIGLSENTNGSNYTGNPFEQLISGLDQLNTIMTHGKEMARMIDHNLKESAKTAENLAGNLNQMEDISMDLHIKAINALIMSKRLGREGMTLSVLAEDVTLVSLDSNAFVLDVVKILKAIEGLATTMSCLSSEDGIHLNDNSVSQMNLSTGIDTITAVYDDFHKKSKKSFEQSKELKNKILRLESELLFMKEIEETLSMQQESIKKIMGDILPFIPEDIKIDKNLDHLSKRYTMEVERGIHTNAINKLTKSVKNFNSLNKKDIGKADKNKEDYLGDNVDLF